MAQHWKALAAEAEAAAWREENKDWAKGLPAEVSGCKVTGTASTVTPGWDQLPWWRMDGKKVGAPAPSTESSKPKQAKRPSRGCWGELTGTPMPLPKLREVASAPAPAELREEKRVLCLPTGQKLGRVTWTVSESRTLNTMRHCKQQKRKQSALDRVQGMELTVTGHQHWVQQMKTARKGELSRLSWSEVDAETVTAPAAEHLDWRDAMARAELTEWVENRLTARQQRALLAEDLSSPATRKAKERAKAKLQELPSHLRLRR